MNSCSTIAEQASIQSFLNGFLLETRNWNEMDLQAFIAEQEDMVNQSEVEKVIRIPLDNQGIDMFAPIRYWSKTGRHQFAFPIYYTAGTKQMLKLDTVTMASLLVKELSFHTGSTIPEEFVLRTILSKQNMNRFLQKHAADNGDKIFSKQTNFIDAEQSLIFGHMLHPTPKSQQGIPTEQKAIYSPEMGGSFPLHYFRVNHAIVNEQSSCSESTTALIKNELQNDVEVDDSFKEKYCQEDGYSLIPVHPLQADFLLKKPEISQLIEQGIMQDLGVQGKSYAPTSSIRTVYNETATFMFKFSLNVYVTNSLRFNQKKELERGVEVDRLLKSEIGEALSYYYPRFHIIRDPAYITLDEKLNITGFETVLRQNPFQNQHAEQAILLSSLCQDNLLGGSTRLATIIHHIAEREKRSIEAVSLDWFQRYLNISLQPIMWLYFTYGIAVEPHQQNAVVQLKDGYPETFYSRDNQGYYICESMANKLRKILPELNEKSDTICDDAIADERLCYYFFINNIFGLINTFGNSRLIDERQLLIELRKSLYQLKHIDREFSELLSNLLWAKELPCKANLLTRFYSKDELVGSLRTQSVYVQIENPLRKVVSVSHAK